MLASSADQEGAAGFMFTDIYYRNTSTTDCVLSVPPALQLLDSDGTPLTATTTIETYNHQDSGYRDPDLEFSAGASPNEIILPAGQTAEIFLNWPSMCSPFVQGKMVAELRLSKSNERIRTQLFGPPRMRDEGCEEPWVTGAGYKRSLSH